jgi:hypothetical protein
MLRNLSLLLITLWVGGLWITGYSAYTLFTLIAHKQTAGNIAGHLFTTISYIGMVSASLLLILRVAEFGASAFKQTFFWTVFLMLLLVLAGHFGIQPLLAQMKVDAMPNDVMNSVFASRFSTWHGVASMAYLLECLLGLVLIFKVR